VTYHPDSVLVEKVAHLLASRPHDWGLLNDSERARRIEFETPFAGFLVEKVGPLVAGVIADRLEEYVGHGRAARFVRREFVDGEA